ncbi:MFS transporter [Novosphingobium aquiterrae]|uniref:MFS transporter n=1 Tax=Novosphingobium aquiterrae TaxID=624388 RepID=A0ABV6PGF4_9SPHN
MTSTSPAAVLPPTERLPLRIKLGNGIGSAAYGVKDNGFSTLLLMFYSQVMGLEARLVGLVLLVALLLDAMIDPLVGYWSDKTHSHWGKRHPWMYAAILPMAAAWIMLWHPPQTSTSWLYGYLLLFAFLMRAAVSCYEIPALSVVPGLTSDYDERTSLTRWRYVFAWAGGLIMLILAFGVFLVPGPGYPSGLLNIEGYNRYGWAGAAMMVVATLICALTTHRRIAALDSSPATHLPLGQTVRKIGRTLANHAFLILLGCTLFAYINLGMTFSTATYLLTYYWEMPQSGFITYSISLFVGVVGAFFLIGFLQSRIEKRTGAVATGLLSLAFGVSPYLLRTAGAFPENGHPMLIPSLFTLMTISNGLAVSSSMLVQSMGADVIEASQERTGERTEGLFFSAYFFTQKCATGLGIFLAGSIVTASGFPAKAEPGAVAAPVLDAFALYFLIALTLIALASLAFISRFPITRADHAQRLARLAGREDAAL